MNHQEILKIVLRESAEYADGWNYAVKLKGKEFEPRTLQRQLRHLKYWAQDKADGKGGPNDYRGGSAFAILEFEGKEAAKKYLEGYPDALSWVGV